FFSFFFFLTCRPLPCSPLFPYTTLFRSLFIVAFRLLTDRDVSTRDVLPGALLSGIVFWLLQQLSSLIIFRYLHNAERISEDSCRSEEHTSELQSRRDLVCRLLLEKKKTQ